MVEKVQVYSRDSQGYICYLEGDRHKPIDKSVSHSVVNLSSDLFGRRRIFYMGNQIFMWAPIYIITVLLTTYLSLEFLYILTYQVDFLG